MIPGLHGTPVSNFELSTLLLISSHCCQNNRLKKFCRYEYVALHTVRVSFLQSLLQIRSTLYLLRNFFLVKRLNLPICCKYKFWIFMTLLMLFFAILYFYIEAKYVFYQKFDSFRKIKFTLICLFIVEKKICDFLFIENYIYFLFLFHYR